MRKGGGGGGGGGICSDQFLKQIGENDILSVYSSHFTAKFSPKRVEIIDMVNDEKKRTVAKSHHLLPIATMPNDFTKKPENLGGGALCHKLTIYKQFSTFKFIKT